MEFVETQVKELRPGNSYIEKLIYSARELMPYCRKLEVDRDSNAARIEGPSIVIMQICLELWRKFVYCGLSYDKILITPVKATQSGYSDKMKMLIVAFKEKENNRSIIKFRNSK